MQLPVHSAQQTWVSYAIFVIIIVIVMALRFRRMGRARPLKLSGLWIVPAVYFVVAAAIFVQSPPTYPVALASIVGLLIGAAVGWQRGKMMHIHVDPETQSLNQKPSPAAMFVLLGLIIVRMGARTILGQTGSGSPAMLTDPLVTFALGMLTLTRVEMYIRAKRLLGEAGGNA